MPNFFDQFDAPAKAKSTGNFFDQFDGPSATFGERFDGSEPTNAPNPQLNKELQRVARAKTTGPTRSGPIEGLAVDYLNQLPAAAQGTTPNIDTQYQNLVSADVHENDAGQILYRDSTGQMLPVDQNKHVMLRDPADQQMKVFRRTDETDEGRAVGLGRALIAGSGAGAVTARPGLTAAPRAAAVPTAAETASTAKPYYQAFDAAAQNSFVQPSQVVDRTFAAMEKAKQPRHLAEEVYTTVSGVSGDSPIPLSRVRDLKEQVGASFGSADKRVRSAAGAASREINDIISDVDPAAGASLRTADKIHAASLGQDKLEKLEKIAGLRTGRAGYGGNAVNNMRQVLSPVVEAAIKGKKTGFKPDEIAAINEIVQGTTATNAARYVGQLSPSKGAIQTGLAFGTAGVTAAVGAAANKLATVLTASQITRLRELVAKRSPAYEEAVAKAVTRFEKAQADLVSNPSSGRFAGLISASRALSNGLTRDGIQVTSGDLLRSIQGPMRGAAEDEQPEAVGGLDQ